MEARYLSRKDIDTIAWDALVAVSPQGSIFTQSWYIDIVADSHWSGIMVYDGDELQAVFPIMIREKYFVKYALQPVLAKYWGICFANIAFQNTQKEYSWKKKCVDAIIASIPHIPVIKYSFSPYFDYPIPFYQKGYKALAKYSFYLDLSLPFEKIEQGFSKSLQLNLKKTDKIDFKLDFNSKPEILISLMKKNSDAGKPLLDNRYLPTLQKLMVACFEHGKGIGLSANLDGNPAAYVFLITDNHSSYGFLNALDPGIRDSAATSLVQKEAIRYAGSVSKIFDFSGSMIGGIEFFFRGFGAKPLPYLSIEKSKFPFSLLNK